MSTLPRVAIRTLGGTIAMARVRPDRAAVPAIDAAELIAAVPSLAEIARVDSASVCNVPSASLSMSVLFDLVDELARSCQAGADGAVITMGTDTLEEVAGGLEFLWPRSEPVVVTGAMRTADAVSADGPGNVAAAVTVAASPAASGRGVLVVMNDEIHSARTVRKTHSTSTAAFASPGSGPVGYVHEGTACFIAAPPRRNVLTPSRLSPVPQVALLRVALGSDTRLLTSAVRDYDGIVIEALGGGHVPDWWVPELRAAASQIPIVMASRTGGGAVLRSTYSFPGSEGDLIDAGVLPAGVLDGLRARILLTLCLMLGSEVGAVLDEFSRHARPWSPGYGQGES